MEKQRRVRVTGGKVPHRPKLAQKLVRIEEHDKVGQRASDETDVRFTLEEFLDRVNRSGALDEALHLEEKAQRASGVGTEEQLRRDMEREWGVPIPMEMALTAIQIFYANWQIPIETIAYFGCSRLRNRPRTVMVTGGYKNERGLLTPATSGHFMMTLPGEADTGYTRKSVITRPTLKELMRMGG